MGLGKVFYIWWSFDVSLEQNMLVSIATLRAVTIWYWTDPKYLPSPMKGREVREQKHSKKVSPPKPFMRAH